MKVSFSIRIFSVALLATFICGCGSFGPRETVVAEKTPNLTRPLQTGSASIRSNTNQSSRDEILRPILTRVNARPSFEMLQSLQTNDRPKLIEYYRSHPDPLDRFAVNWGLGMIGGEETVELLTKALTNDHNGKILVGHSGGIEGNQEFALETTLYALGFLGSKYDAAFVFLTNATATRFWANNQGWKAESRPRTIGVLTSISIVALGITGRTEVPKLLAAMKDQPLKNDYDPSPFARTFEGAVVDAAFYHALIRDYGMGAFQRRFFNSTDVFDADGNYGRWSATEEGKAWWAWYKDREKK